MRIFVTGASGFLGRFLCEELKRHGHELITPSSQQCDLKDPKALEQFDHIRFDRIYHLAAWTQAGNFCLLHPGEQWVINQKINTNLLDWWHSKQPQAFLICMGTSCSYDPQLPLTEEYYLSGRPIESLFTYAMTKRMLLSGVQALHKQYGLRYLYLIPSTLYGPSYHLDGRQMHFIFDLIRKILLGKFHDKPVTLWGDGEQKRELIHVKDFVSIVEQLAATSSNDIFNVGSGVEHSIKEFAQLICDKIGYPFGKIHFDTSQYVGARSKVLSVIKLQKKLPALALMPIERGLEETIDWFKEAFLSFSSIT